MNVSEGASRDRLIELGALDVLRGGWPDFLVTAPGYMFAVEVKTMNDRLSQAQFDMLDTLSRVMPVFVERDGSAEPFGIDVHQHYIYCTRQRNSEEIGMTFQERGCFPLSPLQDRAWITGPAHRGLADVLRRAAAGDEL